MRTSWRRDAPDCSCPICSDPLRKHKYLELSRSTSYLRRTLLPCGEIEYPNYSLPGVTFKAFNGLCCLGRCPKRGFLNAPSPHACGWGNVFGTDCPVEASDAPFTWHRWEPRLRGENVDDKGELKKFYSDEWVPYTGTRREFLAECAGPPQCSPHVYV